VNIWVDENRTGKVKALPDKYSSFGGWTGTTTSGEEDLNVVMKQPHNVTANFIPMLTSNGTPYAWLAGFGLTNGFEHEDGLDQDGDRAFTWQEHVADTCPTNSDDVFSMSVNRTAVDLHNTSTERIYGVKGRPNLSEGTWQEYIGGFTGNDGTVSVELNDGDNFYEGTVSKPSEE